MSSLRSFNFCRFLFHFRQDLPIEQNGPTLRAYPPIYIFQLNALCCAALFSIRRASCINATLYFSLGKVSEHCQHWHGVAGFTYLVQHRSSMSPYQFIHSQALLHCRSAPSLLDNRSCTHLFRQHHGRPLPAFCSSFCP